LQIRFYGRLSDGIGTSIDLDVPCSSSVGQIREHLGRLWPAIATHLLRSRAIIDDRAVADEHCIGPATEIAFLPPVSGG
jgi:molybdopterin converting factor small subunit